MQKLFNRILAMTGWQMLVKENKIILQTNSYSNQIFIYSGTANKHRYFIGPVSI